MNNWFGNLSVTKKLMTGFGVVLLMTSLLALAGWSSLNSMIARIDKMSGITELNNRLTDLRVKRLQYMLAKGDENATRAMQLSLDAFVDQQRALLSNMSVPSNLEKLNKQAAVTNKYTKSFIEARENYKKLDDDLQKISSSSKSAQPLIEQMFRDHMQDVTIGSLENLQKAVDLKDSFYQIRFNVQKYLNTPTDQGKSEVLGTIDNFIADLKNAPLGSLNDQQSIADVKVLMESYRRAILSASDATDSIAAKQRDLVELGKSIWSISEDLYKYQIVIRDQVSIKAKVLQLSAAALAILFGVIAAWVITRQITVPLKLTLDAVKRISSGDLTQDQIVTRKDELGALQAGIQQMGATLRSLIGGIRDGVVQIASAAEELRVVTGQTSAGVHSQKVETDQVATAMHEMSTTVHEVARNAEQASVAASNADKQARDGDKVVGEAIVQIEKLASEVMRSADAMDVLERESNKIGKVMDVIKAVAEQTNLLALNAAIEAARAGEAGRGFAVVADEVRGLAQRTQQSTEEIEGLVAALQTGTRQVSGIMLNSRNLTDNSVALTRKAGTSLENITNTVSTIQSMNQQIAAAAEQQSSVAEEISRSILNVRDVSEQTAAASEETAVSSVELARLGSQLQLLVSHFKV